jgi:hypothetical protein
MNKKELKLAEKRVERVYYQTCSGVQINIMDIGKVFKVGVAAVAEGVDDETLGKRIRAYVDTISKGVRA